MTNFREWKASRREARRREHKNPLVIAWEVAAEFVAAILVETIEAIGRVLSALARVTTNLSERHKLWSRLALVVALAIAVDITLIAHWVLKRVFGPAPPVVSDGTAAALGWLAGIVTAICGVLVAVSGFYMKNRNPGVAQGGQSQTPGGAASPLPGEEPFIPTRGDGQ